MDRKKLYFAAAGIGMGILARGVLRKPAGFDLYSKVVMIAGKTDALSLALAREFAAEGSRLALAGNDSAELDLARQDLEARRAKVLPARCDVTNVAQVDGAIEAVIDHYGQIDILVNYARMTGDGMAQLSLEDIENAMQIMFWGMVYPTRAALPQMLERRAGHIVNIISDASSGSPHLLPLNCAKFAAIGFSEGLRAELMPEGISVVTIFPPANGASDPRTARHIVAAALRGETNGFGITGRTDIPGLLQNLLPQAGATKERSSRPIVTALATLGRIAARRYLQA
jgi:NAD(P)-dependent dehydrogenase (short-subunit alcohol dehydrogenase family)